MANSIRPRTEHCNSPKRLPKLSETDIARFWNKVDKTPGHGPKGNCWPWTYKTGTQNKHVKITMAGRKLWVHRIAYFLQKGKDPWPLIVCHKCDYPPCCRGSHLFLGTQADNIADAVAKGRNASGERHGYKLHPETVARGEQKIKTAKLNTEKVIEIRRLFEQGNISKAALGRMFGVHHIQIGRIIRRTRWAHIP